MICTLKVKLILQHVKHKYVSENFMALSLVWVIELYPTIPIMNGFEKRLSKHFFMEYKLCHFCYWRLSSIWFVKNQFYGEDA